MINPDGVWHGHLRKDRFLQNLNRFYKRPTLQKQPTCWALRHIMEYFSESHRLIFFSDFHAHSGVKNAFVYGNYCNFVRQVESRLFTKINSMLGQGFSHVDSDFSMSQMKGKERGDESGKEACARVLGYHLGGLAHSYTLELSYHSIIDQETKEEIRPFEISDIEEVGENFVLSLLYQFGVKKNFKDAQGKIIQIDLKSLREEIALNIKKLFIQDENRLEIRCKEIHSVATADYYQRLFKDQMDFIKGVLIPKIPLMAGTNFNTPEGFHLSSQSAMYPKRDPPLTINGQMIGGQSLSRSIHEGIP
jgi:hypothetical protein